MAGLTLSSQGSEFPVLKPAAFAPHIARFNAMEDENVTNLVSNARAFDWLAGNIPRFECPDPEVEEIYYFRWWSFRKHLKQTAKGFVFTEFLVPMRHAGPHNTISCAAGHHLAEGRWLHEQRYLDDYIRFWLRGHGGKPQPHFHQFSGWFAAAVWERYLVNGDRTFVTGILDDLVADYRAANGTGSVRRVRSLQPVRSQRQDRRGHATRTSEGWIESASWQLQGRLAQERVGR